MSRNTPDLATSPSLIQAAPETTHYYMGILAALSGWPSLILDMVGVLIIHLALPPNDDQNATELNNTRSLPGCPIL